MTPSVFLFVVACLLLSSSSHGTSSLDEAIDGGSASSNEAPLPNILYVVMDDLGSGDLGYHGSGIKTPMANTLIKHGVYLKNFYTQSACTTTRTAIMTGRYPYTMGLYSVIRGDETRGVPLGEEFLPQVLRKVGYQCHAVGKWHLGNARRDFTPTHRGFQSFYGFIAGGGQGHFSHISHAKENGKGYDMRWEPQEFCNETCSQLDNVVGEYSSFLFARKSVDVIENHNKADGPLFLYLAFAAVHAPLEVPQKYINMYNGMRYKNGKRWTLDRRKYAGMLTAADESLQTVINALKKQNMWNDTIVVYQTDNGGSRKASSNFPRRGWKYDVWEGGIQGDGFLSGPALKKLGIPTKRTLNSLFHTVDMLPTLASLTGATPTGKPLDGMDQSSTLRGGPPVRQDMFLGYSEGTRDRYDHPLNGAYSALRWKNWKIIRFPNFETFKLYNLNLDPRELNDLSSKKPSMVRFLQKRMEAYESGFLLSLTDQGGDDCTTDDLVFGTTPWGEPAWQPWCDLLEN